MHALSEQAAPAVIRLSDYRAPAWRVETVELDFDLGIDASELSARLLLRRDPAQDAPLRLDGEDLQLLSIKLDGQQLPATAYRYAGNVLEVDGARDGSVLETRVRLRPAANTALEGLYLSGSRESGFLLTQCEAEGFRHITFFPDRPDVLSRYTVTLRADRARFPVLLAGGNPDGAGELEGGRHWARFVDPHPKPSYLFALVAGRLERIERDYVTADGRAVQLKIWAEADAIDRCHYAMDALERAMRWDEQAYGRNYDLDVFHVVATHDFNMGAMENKGLNIFNAKCLLADPDSTTDDEYRHVEAVVAPRVFPQLERQPRHLPRLVPALAEGRPHGIPRAELLGRHELRAAEAHRGRVAAASRAVPRGRRPAGASGAPGAVQRDQQFLHRHGVRERRRAGAHAGRRAGPGRLPPRHGPLLRAQRRPRRHAGGFPRRAGRGQRHRPCALPGLVRPGRHAAPEGAAAVTTQPATSTR